MRKSVLFFLLVLLYCNPSFAQPDFVPGATTVRLSAKTLDLSSDFPYDNPFVLLVYDIPPKTEKAILYFVEGFNIPAHMDSLNTFNRFGDAFYMIIEFSKLFRDEHGHPVRGKYLSPNTAYTFKIVFLDSNNSTISSIQRSNYTRTKLGDYIKPDFGFGYSPHINGTFGFTDAHIYLAAINNDADLGKLKGIGKQILLRTSFYFGISPLTIYYVTKQPINKLTGAGNFVYGVGVRSPFYGWCGENRVSRTILQPMRIVVGEMVFSQNKPDPLVTQSRVKQTFYLGISWDFIIKSLVDPVTKLYLP